MPSLLGWEYDLFYDTDSILDQQQKRYMQFLPLQPERLVSRNSCKGEVSQ